jgi:hypothetical protein
MLRTRNPPRSAKFDKNAIDRNGLACPFATIPYQAADVHCRKEKGFGSLSRWREHLTRKHGFPYGCLACGASWTSVNRHTAENEMEKHDAICAWKARGEQDPQARFKGHRLTREQWEQIEKIKPIWGEAELAKIYQACGVPPPSCYHVNPLAPTNTGQAHHTVTHHQPPTGGFLQGFQPPMVQYGDAPDPPPSQGVTYQTLVQLQDRARADQYFPVSGEDAEGDDRDSAYYSRSDDVGTGYVIPNLGNVEYGELDISPDEDE